MKTVHMALALALLCAMSVRATAAQTAEREFTCPVDEHKFNTLVVTERDGKGGVDSDLCAYEQGKQALPHEVHTCPKCGFTATTREFAQSLGPEPLKRVQDALTEWKDANKPDDWTKLTVWQQYELAAVCGFAKFAKTYHAGRLYHSAAWSARQQAAALIPADIDLTQPLTAIEAVDLMRGRINREADEEKKNALRMRLVQASHRAGMGALRDATIISLDAIRHEDPSYRSFKQFVAVEKRYLQKAAEMYLKAVETNEVDARNAAICLYLVGDINRRLGRNDDARRYYQQAVKSGNLRPDLAELVDFIQGMLDNIN